MRRPFIALIIMDGWGHREEKEGNAVALADRKFCARAVKEMDFFTVNFPSHLPEIYARATRSVKFHLALEGLENLRKAW